jgi:hypothetical protein
VVLEYPVDTFTCRDVAGIQIEVDFILAVSELHGGAVMAFVYILVNVFDSLD